jgi:hypothetical protein
LGLLKYWLKRSFGVARVPSPDAVGSMSPAGHFSLFHHPCPSLLLPFSISQRDPSMAGGLLYRTDCPILIQTTAVD